MGLHGWFSQTGRIAVPGLSYSSIWFSTRALAPLQALATAQAGSNCGAHPEVHDALDSFGTLLTLGGLCGGTKGASRANAPDSGLRE